MPQTSRQSNENATAESMHFQERSFSLSRGKVADGRESGFQEPERIGLPDLRHGRGHRLPSRPAGAAAAAGSPSYRQDARRGQRRDGTPRTAHFVATTVVHLAGTTGTATGRALCGPSTSAGERNDVATCPTLQEDWRTAIRRGCHPRVTPTCRARDACCARSLHDQPGPHREQRLSGAAARRPARP